MPVDFGFIKIKWYTYFYTNNVHQHRERERERCLTNKCITEKNTCTCTLPHLEDYVKLYCNDHLYWYLHCYFIETT